MASLLSNLERVPVSSVQTHPQNARRGDVDVIASSLAANEQFSPIVVQRSTNYVLSGNHTLLAARKLKWEEIDVVFVDVDDRAANKIMLAANRTADKGSYDTDALVELLSYLDGDYDGTGYTDEDVNKLIDPQLPEPGDADTDDDLQSAWGVIVSCRDESQQVELLQRFTADGLDVRALTA